MISSRVLAVIAVMAVGGVALTVVGITHRPRPVSRGVVPPVTAASPAAVPPLAATSPAAVPAAGSFPTSVTLAGVRTPVTPVSTTQGQLEVPPDPHVVGWWAGGAAPGSASGTVVLDGHVDTAAAGAGALFHLRSTAVGTVISVAGEPSTTRYRITGVREYDKADLPAASIFATTGAPRLVLITCGGAFDRTTRHYRDNVVAYAVPVPGG